MSLDALRESWWVGQLAASAALVAVVVLLRWALAARLKRSSIRSPDLKRRWLAQVRNAAFLIIVVGLFAIWSTELRSLAISLLAFAFALVLATKELILCLTGSILKARAGAFAIGDRIEVNGLRGDVVDQTLLSTRLAEVGSGPTAHKFTGRSVTLPNSLFLTTPVVNESAIGRYVFRSLEVEVEADGSWQEAERRLLEAAGAACGPELAKANQALRRRADREGMDSMEVEPRVTIAHPSSDKIHLIVRFPAPLERALAVEQEVLRRFLSGAKPMTGAGAQGDNPGQG